MVGVSAKTGENIEQLLDMLLLVTDLEQEKIVADPNLHALGTIIESNVDRGQGPVATVLVQSGTLHIGDVLGVRGTLYGKVRAMKTWDAKDVKEALPSTPVKILGFKAAPSIGDILEVPADVKDLEKLKAQPTRKSGVEEVTVRKTKAAQTVEGEARDLSEEKVYLNLVIRADVLGSLEAIIGMLEKIDSPYVGVKIVAKGLGNINDSDILHCEATGAMLIAFNVKPMAMALTLARDKGIEIHQYNVIYKFFEEIVERLRILIPAEKVYEELGSVNVLAVFQKIDKGLVIGGQVTKGIISVGATARVIREGEIIAEGKIDSLQAGKTNATSVEQGQQCGIGFKGKAKIEVGDTLEIYKEEEHARTLNVAGSK